MRYRLLSFFLGALLISGCTGLWSSPEAEYPVSIPSEFELVLQRGSLTGSDFEQYRRLGNDLFVECGVLEQGRFVARESSIVALNPALLEQVASPLTQITEAIDRKHQFAEAGSITGLFGPGRFVLRYGVDGTSHELTTSFDAVVNGVTRPDEALRLIAELIRSSVPSPCGQRTFYGLGARQARDNLKVASYFFRPLQLVSTPSLRHNM